ncbi:MAG: sialate O-acetylesterase [Bacteroidales bacterium]|nr:sialate O-acetylesterase [Bacteroidales bacterium]
MKKTLFSLYSLSACLTALLLCIGAAAQDYDVYLCIGQSNMAGRGILEPQDREPVEGVFLLGPEDTPVPATGDANIWSTIRKKASMQGYNLCIPFARKMYARTGRPVLLVVNARGGTMLDQWVKDAPCHVFNKREGDDPEKIGHPIPQFYAEAVRRGKAAMRYGPLKGILWHQGEGDRSQALRETYMERLGKMVSDLRADLGVGEEVPFVLGETYHGGVGAPVNPTLAQVGYFIPNAYCASADGCPANRDNLHFSHEGLTRLGERYAEAMLGEQPPVRYVKARNPFLHQWIMYPSTTLDDLPLVPVADRTDRWGGLKGGPRFKKTGFFRTERYKGRWILVDPDGRMHIDASVAAFRPGRGEAQKASFAGRFASPAEWYESQAGMVLSCGFNGSAAFSDHESNASFNRTHRKKKFTYQVILNLMSGYAHAKKVAYQLPGHTGYPGGCILVFDPGFEAYCDSVLAARCPKYAADPHLVGYFSDNELPFGLENLSGYLSLPESDPGHQAAERWLAEKGIDSTQVTDAVRHEFAGWVAGRYYETVSRLLRRYDPSHLYLGSRLHGDAKFLPEVVEAAGKYCDVVSYNYYSDWEVRPEEISRWNEWSGKPFMITEFYTKGEDAGLPNTRGAGWRVPTQKDRAVHYQNFVLKLLMSDSCVGWNWFKYQDNDPTDRTTDPSNRDSNKGMVDNAYEVYPDLVESMKAVNERRYALLFQFLPAGR